MPSRDWARCAAPPGVLGRHPRHLVKVSVPVQSDDLEPTIPFDALDWDRDFDAYIRTGVANGKAVARRRLALDIDDDTLPCYHPYFGISIHHSFFGGKVVFGGGTSYAEHVITQAADWPQLHADADNPWLQRLLRGMAYCRDHGEGVLLASYRGGNGPLDMAVGVLGNAFYTEVYDDPENVHKLVDICTQATLMTFDLQRQHCTEIAGGHICPMGNVWLPGDRIGHVSLDAACMGSPALYDEFEKPYLEGVAARTGGMFIHTHMLGRHMFRNTCSTPGVLAFAPADDPNQPTLLDELESVLDAAGDVPLMVHIPQDRLAETLPMFQGRRVILSLAASTRDDALAQLEAVHTALAY